MKFLFELKYNMFDMILAIFISAMINAKVMPWYIGVLIIIAVIPFSVIMQLKYNK